jgi:GT2 family glycosyltransferase
MKKDTVANLLNVFRETGADAVSGKPLRPHKGNFLGMMVGLIYEDSFEMMGESFVNVAATTCLAVKKSAFKSIGGFNEYSEGEAIGEDWDLTARLSQAGFKIFHTNKVEVFHEHGSDTLKKYMKRQYQHARYRVGHFKKFGKTTDSYSSPKFFLESMLFFNIPAAIRAYSKTHEKKVFIGLPLITVLRTVAWLYGMIVGVTRD